MPDETTTTVPEGQTPATPPAGATQTETPPADVMIPKSRFDEVNKRLKELEATLSKTAKEREAADRAQLEEQKRFQELYESERKRAADLEARANTLAEERRQEKMHGSIRQAAQAVGFTDPEDAVRFMTPDALQVDDAGNVANARAVVESIAKNKPYLLGGSKPTPGVQAGPKPARTTPLTAADVRNMTRDDMVKNWDAVQAAMNQ